MYEQARAEAQDKANRTGCHVRLYWNDYARRWFHTIVPAPKFQYGRDLEGELVVPERKTKTDR